MNCAIYPHSPNRIINLLHLLKIRVTYVKIGESVYNISDVTVDTIWVTRWRNWLRFAVSILDGVIGIFIDIILPAAVCPWG